MIDRLTCSDGHALIGCIGSAHSSCNTEVQEEGYVFCSMVVQHLGRPRPHVAKALHMSSACQPLNLCLNMCHLSSQATGKRTRCTGKARASLCVRPCTFSATETSEVRSADHDNHCLGRGVVNGMPAARSPCRRSSRHAPRAAAPAQPGTRRAPSRTPGQRCRAAIWACLRARTQVRRGSGRRRARGSPALHRAAAVRPRAGLLRTLDMRGWLAS